MALRRTLVALVCLLGCSQASSAPGLDGGVLEGATEEPGETGMGDGGWDAEPITDAREAGKDAGAWCDTQGFHLFCDDFDQGLLTQSWDTAVDQHGTTVLDGTTYTSPPGSFLATTMPLEQGAVAADYLSKSIVNVATEIHLAYDLRADALDPAGASVVVSSIQMFDGAGELIERVDVALSTAGATVNDYSPSLDGGMDWSASHAFSPAPTPAPASLGGHWERIVIDILLPVDGGIGGGTLTVHAGDAAAPVVDHAPMGPRSQASEPELYLGVVYAAGPSSAVAVRFDNLTLDLQR